MPSNEYSAFILSSHFVFVLDLIANAAVLMNPGLKLFTTRSHVITEISDSVKELLILRKSIEDCSVAVKPPRMLCALTPTIRKQRLTAFRSKHDLRGRSGAHGSDKQRILNQAANAHEDSKTHMLHWRLD